jgi:hypothetical protein
MANQTAPRSAQVLEDIRLRRYPNTASTANTFYPAQMMGTDSTGTAKNIDDTAKMWIRGILDSTATIYTTTSDLAGKYQIPVALKPFSAAMTSATIADLFKAVFISDNQTVALAPGSFGNYAGYIFNVPSTTAVFVVPPDNPRGGLGCDGMRGVRTLAATGADALTLLDINCYIICPNSAAKTTTLPAAAGLQYGDKLFFIKSGGGAFVWTLDGNSSNIQGASTFVSLDANLDSQEFTWYGSTIGWLRSGGFFA